MLGMLLPLLVAVAQAPGTPAPAAAWNPRVWAGRVESPGGPVRFTLEVGGPQGSGPRPAALVNAGERRAAAAASWSGSELVVRFDPYDSELRATVDAADRLSGTWTKRSGDRTVTLPFHAEAIFRPEPYERVAPDLHGRWLAEFSSSPDPAVLVLRAAAAGEPTAGGARAADVGTFLTTLGDYRFLSVYREDEDGRLVMDCFDGAHLFKFTAELQPDGTLEGDFWSGDRWHETWTAVRDPEAALPDPFGISSWNRDVRLADMAYPDLEGRLRSLDDEAFRGKARILQAFGTWCPNCNDEAPFLAELDRRYRERGLAILGLAFEHGDDHAYAAGRVRSYAERYGIDYPILVAGTSDKQAASEAFPLLDRVRAFPTTLFLDATGRVRAVHTGFSGPATGPEHEKLRADFERLVESLLAEADEEDR